MTARTSARALTEVRRDAATCERCPLCAPATQTVFGEGPADARAVLVGEQPGDREDRSGRPFVGPAGGILDRALTEAGLDRSSLYLTNAVKHFKHRQRGKARIHQKPDRSEVAACRHWLDLELVTIAPELVVALGATAAQDLLGPSFRVTKQRGEVLRPEGLPPVVATIHPSAVLRGDDREALFAGLVDDLRLVATFLDP